MVPHAALMTARCHACEPRTDLSHFEIASWCLGGFCSYSLFVGPEESYGWIQYGSPSVAYKGPSTSSCAYVFAWKDADDTVYTQCKGAAYNSGLTSGTVTAHYFNGSRVMSPVIGSSAGAAELFTTWIPGP